MANIYNKPGFDFSNVVRNSFLEAKGIHLPKATSTGTTIVGCLFKDGIVLGADTRATSGPIVADKNCEKVRCKSRVYGETRTNKFLITRFLVALRFPTPRYITSLKTFDVVELELQLILSSPLLSSPQISNFMHYRLVESRGS
jgi:hypothetical protein